MPKVQYDDGFRIIKIVHCAALTVSEYSHKKCVKDILIQYCKNKVKYSIKTSIAFAIFLTILSEGRRWNYSITK